MAGAFKRKSDKARGKAGKWTGWFFGPDGRKQTFSGTTDKATTLQMAQAKEAEAALARAGLVDRRDIAARDAAAVPLSAHLLDYGKFLSAKGDTGKHVNHVLGVLERLLRAARVATVADIRPDSITTALGRLDRSARTKNHALSAVRGFSRWLYRNHRLKDDPLATMTARYNEGADVRRKRRDLTPEEMGRLLAATEDGPPYLAHRPHKSKHHETHITGADRAMCYRIAAGTGFRASEIRSLIPESFHLGAEACIVVAASYTKNGREAVQPIRRDLAVRLLLWLDGRAPGRPVLDLPAKTAKMLRSDLAAAGIPYEAPAGVVDFHSLRGVYVTRLVESGASIKTVQELARHSTPTLTVGRYTRTDDKRKREALEGLE